MLLKFIGVDRLDETAVQVLQEAIHVINIGVCVQPEGLIGDLG